MQLQAPHHSAPYRNTAFEPTTWQKAAPRKMDLQKTLHGVPTVLPTPSWLCSIEEVDNDRGPMWW